MPSLGSLYYTLGIKDLTDADLKKINAKLKSVGSEIQLTPKILKDITQSAVPKGIKIELDPTIKSDAIAKAVEGKTMRIAVTPLLTGFREAIRKATRENPPQAEIGVSEARLRTVVQNVLNKQGFMLNISTVNDNYTKAIQAKLNGTNYRVKIHADAKEIARSVQASLMQVQSRYFGLKVSRDVLYRSIDEALGHKRFNINIAVQQDQARRAVQDALLRAQVMGKDQALAYQRLQTGEMKAAQAELQRLKSAHIGAAEAAKTHATASVNLGGAMGRNITIAGELGSAMASIYSIHAAKEFLSQVIEIGGELEHQKIAMDTIFGDKGKTNELFGQIKGLARQSPFGVMELTKSVKALSAYGVEYNEIYDTAKRLADISAATSVDINRLILAFGKTKSRGFLDGLEAKQFAYANIPIYEMVRKKLEELEGQAVTTADVMARMKKREIGFDIVKDVLWDITDPGGKFYNMQEALAGSVKTSWKLVRDNIELMFGEVAEGRIGASLKSVAEILQVLTRNWRTMGVAIGFAAAAFGAYKVAVLASNTMMGKATAINLAHRASQNKLNVSLIQSAQSYRALAAEEVRELRLRAALQKVASQNIFTNKALTSAEIELLVAEKALTRDSAARLIAMGKISPMQARYLIKQKLITIGDLRAAVAARQHGLSIKLLGKEITLASFRFKMLGTAILSAGKALGAMFIKALPLAAISALVAVWQKHNEQIEKAKEIGDNLFTKATEGANNLKQSLKDIKPSAGLSEHELTQGIEQMEQLIKDYSAHPLQDINDTLVSQDGHVLTLTERYDALQKKIEAVAAAYKLMGDTDKGDMGGMITDSIAATGGWFNEDVIQNAKDYTNALKKRDELVRKQVKEDARLTHEYVAAAEKADASFAKAVKNMTSDAQKLNELVRGSGDENIYEKGLKAAQGVNLNVGSLRNYVNTDAARSEFKKDVEAQIEEITADIKTKWGVEVSQLSDVQKEALAISLKNMIEQAEGVSETVKMQWAQLLEEAFGVKIIEDKIGPSLKENFVKEVNGATDASIIAVADKWKNEGWDALSDAEKKIVSDMMEDAKSKTMSELGILHDNMQKYLASNPLTQTIELAYTDNLQTTAYQKAVWASSPRLGALLSQSVPSPLVGAGGLSEKAKKQREWYNSWTRGSKGDYETKNRIKSELEGAYNEILASKGRTKEYRKALQDEYDAMQELASAMGFGDIDVGAQKSNKHPKSKGAGSQKDALAESLRQRFKDIKDAYAMYKEWAKLEGKEAAFKRVGDSGLFSTLKPEEIPQAADEYLALIDKLEKELKAAGIKGKSQRESLANDIIKERFGINKDTFKEELQLALDKVSKEAERQLADWNLFDKIRKATGNQDLAMSIAFGMNADAETDYVSMIKKQFKAVAEAEKSALSYDTATPELLAEAPEEVKKAWEKANSEILKYFDQQREAVAGILTEYQTLQDRIDAINAKRKNALETINAKDKNGNYILSEAERSKRSTLVNTQADYEIFTQSNEYLRFFNDIYGLTMDEANRIGDLIQLNLNQKLQAGLITIYDYEKEMEKVRKQLEALRNIKSDAMTFLTGGFKGLSEKKLRKAEGELANNKDYQDALTEQVKAQNALNKAKEEGNEDAIKAAEEQLRLANLSVKTFTKIRDAIISGQERMQSILDVANLASNIAGGMSDAFNSIKDMADAFGVDTDSGAWGDIGAVMDTLTAVTGGIQKVIQSAMSGDVGGILGGVVSTITSPFTIWAQLHDKKLQKMIERSKEYSQQLQYINDAISRRMEYFLGNAADMKVIDAERDKAELDKIDKRVTEMQEKLSKARPGITRVLLNSQIKKDTAESEKLRQRVDAYNEGGAYGYQRQLMAEQLAELEKQRQAEIDKKKTDKSVVADYDNQIDEMKVQIRQFAEETANTLYGIDLNGWAEQLGEALVDAFAKGEDAAEAFDNTVADILRSMTSKIISTGVIAPMFEKLRENLFGKDGLSGWFGSDFKLDAQEMGALKSYLDMIKNQGIPRAQELFDAINEATGGLLTETDKAKSGLTAGIQSITEDTADLLASYVNAIRASVAMNEGRWERLLTDSLPQISVIAQSQLDAQRQIAENTLRTAEAAEAIVKSNDEINRLLARATQGGAKFYIH